MNLYDKFIFKSRMARTIFFVIFVGGLFMFTSVIFKSLCNEIIFDYFQFPCISYLESAGILSFGYILAFGIKFGLLKPSEPAVQKENIKYMTEGHKTNCQDNDNMSEECKKNIDMMTAEEKTRLKVELEKRCGIK